MHLIILTIMLTATLPAYAGPAAKLSRQLGINHRTAGAAPAVPSAGPAR
jgi:hypothetical protein